MSRAGPSAGLRGNWRWTLYVRNDNRAAQLIKLVISCAPLEIDEPQPGITMVMPDED